MSPSSTSPSDPIQFPSGRDSSARNLNPEATPTLAKLRQLRDKFAVDGGTESMDLALDLVLNELVQQVRITTRATGAAVALLRGDEMVCRATTGGNAPDLGVRLDTKMGLSGACVQTRHTQLCGDTELDNRVDVAACRALGVRSILVLPLLAQQKLIGVFEIFSPLPRAFGDRDVQTLEAFVRQILQAVQEAKSLSENVTVPAEPPPSLEPPPSFSSLTPRLAADDGDGEAPPRGRDFLTPILTALVIALAIVLGTLLGLHISRGRKVPAPALRPAANNSAVAPPSKVQASNLVAPGSPAPDAKPVPANSTANPVRPAGQGTTGGGGLVIYQNDQVVFRMPTSGDQNATAVPSSASPKTVSSQAVSVDRPLPNLPELSPEDAQVLLIKHPEPDYPPEVLAGGLQGAVKVRVVVDGSGAVRSQQFAGGTKALAPAALEAVRQWHFSPYLVAGKPTDFQTVVTVHFAAP